MNHREFIRELTDWLQRDGQPLLDPDVDTHWKTEFELDVADNGIPKVKCDLRVVLRQGTEFFVEVENSNGYADANVVKYWYYLENRTNKKSKVFLVQVLNPTTFGKRNYRSRREIAQFVAQLLKNEFSFFCYKPIPLWGKEGVQEVKNLLRQIALR